MDESQIIIIGLCASALTLFLKLLASYGDIKPSRIVVNIVLYGISVIFAVAWSKVSLPTTPGYGGDIPAYVSALWNYLNAWIALGAPILGSATLIYNLLYEKVVVPLKVKLFKS